MLIRNIRDKKNNWIAFCLSVALVSQSLGLFPATVYAAGTGDGEDAEAVETFEYTDAVYENTDEVYEIHATGYVQAPDAKPPAASHLGKSLRETEAIRVGDGTEPDVGESDAGFTQASSLPAAYPYGYLSESALKNYLKTTLPAVRNQNPYGTCWAHATAGAAEIDMIKRYGMENTIDYSELHLIYWSLHQGTNPVMGDTGDKVLASAAQDYMMRGGNSVMTSQALLKRRGIAAEQTLPYNEKNTVAANAGTLVASAADEFNDEAHLQNHYRINLEENAEQVKQAIQEHGSVQVSYYDEDGYYSSKYNSFYNDKKDSVNHAVLLVGWDDAFPKEHFVKTAKSDGAWLVRNSWGYSGTELMSHSQYFWLSYEDVGLLSGAAADVFEMSPADDGYDNQYFYDSQLGLSTNWTGKNMSAANVYSVGGVRQQSAEAELLRAVTIATLGSDNTYTIEVYTGLTSKAKPTSGTRAATVSGMLAFEGEYTIELPEPVMLERGDLFSIVVKLGQGSVPIEYRYAGYSTVTANAGESYINYGDSQWHDIGVSGYGNFRISALTKDVGMSIENLEAVRRGTAATLTWDALSSADRYTIYRGTSPKKTDTKIAEVSASVTSYIDTGLDAKTLYYYRVKANKGADFSGVATLLRELTPSDIKVKNTGTFPYDGKAKELTVVFPEGTGDVQVFYFKKAAGSSVSLSSESSSTEWSRLADGESPKQPGTYRLGVRIVEDGDVFAKSMEEITDDSWLLVIDKMELTAFDFSFTSNVIFAYDDVPNAVHPVIQAEYTGELSYQYAMVDGRGKVGAFTAMEPSASGTYQVCVSGGESETYQAFSALTDTSWRFRIAEKPYTAPASADIADGAEVESGTKVRLASATPDAVIYYTLDGSTPSDKNGTKYTGLITLERIRKVLDEGFFDSEATSDGEDNITGNDIIPQSDIVTLKAIAVKNDIVSDISVYTYHLAAPDFGDITAVEIEEQGFASPEDVPEHIWVSGLPQSVDYTGKAIKFADLRIYDHTRLLTPGDYKISYSSNVNAGTASITVKGVGNYTGSITKNFQINKINLEKAQADGTVVIEDIYLKATGRRQSPKPTVLWNGKKLKLGRDYTLDYQMDGTQILEPKDTFYTVAVEAAAAGNFTGKAVCRVKVYPAEKMDLKKASVSKIPPQAYLAGGYTNVNQLKNADGAFGSLTVKNGGTKLRENVDYTVEFRNADKSGMATLLLIAKDEGAYAGVKKVNFKIEGQSVNTAFHVGAIADQTYTGAGITPILTVKDNSGKLLQEGIDYTAAYSANVNPGTAKVVITGLAGAGYSGSVTKTFQIKKYVLANSGNNLNVSSDGAHFATVATGSCTISFEQTVAYTKGGTTPAVTIRANGKALVQGRDYMVKYLNYTRLAKSTDPMPPTIVITGKGGFDTPKGGIRLYYTITEGELSLVDVYGADKVYKNTANIYRSTIVLTDTNGRKLTAGTDYDKNMDYFYDAETVVTNMSGKTPVTVIRAVGESVDKNDIIPAGTVIRAVVYGKNNYSGSIVVRYRIVKGDLSKAKVTVQNQTYTGKALEPEGNAANPSMGDIVVRIGEDILVYGRDYKVTGYSNNIKQGKNTASVTIAGCGANYGGMKTVKFTIKPKNLLTEALRMRKALR